MFLALSDVQIFILLLIFMVNIDWIIDRICKCVEQKQVSAAFQKALTGADSLAKLDEIASKMDQKKD